MKQFFSFFANSEKSDKTTPLNTSESQMLFDKPEMPDELVYAIGNTSRYFIPDIHSQTKITFIEPKTLHDYELDRIFLFINNKLRVFPGHDIANQHAIEESASAIYLLKVKSSSVENNRVHKNDIVSMLNHSFTAITPNEETESNQDDYRRLEP